MKEIKNIILSNILSKSSLFCGRTPPQHMFKPPKKPQNKKNLLDTLSIYVTVTPSKNQKNSIFMNHSRRRFASILKYIYFVSTSKCLKVYIQTYIKMFFDVFEILFFKAFYWFTLVGSFVENRMSLSFELSWRDKKLRFISMDQHMLWINFGAWDNYQFRSFLNLYMPSCYNTITCACFLRFTEKLLLTW